MIFDGIEARPREAARDDGDLARAAVGHDRANRLRSAAGSQYENLLSLDRHARKLDKVGEAVIIGVVAVELTILSANNRIHAPDDTRRIGEFIAHRHDGLFVRYGDINPRVFPVFHE